jgi:hypothetical protein
MNIRYGEGKERRRERLLHKVRKVQGTAAPGEYSLPLHLKGVPATDYFVARKQDMQHLADFFASPSQSPERQQRVFIVHGLGGMGKTQLCAEFVKTHADWSSAVLWLDGPSKDSLTDPTSGVQLSSNSAAVQVYLQAFKAYEETYPNMRIEIWRANYVLPGGKVSANFAVKVRPSADSQPCANDFTEASHWLGSVAVNPGSPIIDIIGDELEFDITDWGGNVVQRGCSFVGTGIYKPLATVAQELAGNLTCSGGYTVSCARPSYNYATTCGSADVKTCGDVGKN